MNEVFIFALTIGRVPLEVEFNVHDDYLGIIDLLPKSLYGELEDFNLQLFEDYKEHSLCSIWDDYRMDWDFEKTGIEFSPVFMTQEQYERFVEKLHSDYIPKYEQLKTEIIGKYDEMKVTVIGMLEERYPNISNEVDSKLPSKSDFAKSFMLNIPEKPIKIDLDKNPDIIDEIKRKSSLNVLEL